MGTWQMQRCVGLASLFSLENEVMVFSKVVLISTVSYSQAWKLEIKNSYLSC